MICDEDLTIINTTANGNEVNNTEANQEDEDFFALIDRMHATNRSGTLVKGFVSDLGSDLGSDLDLDLVLVLCWFWF
jgi:hypothetical protein